MLSHAQSALREEGRTIEKISDNGDLRQGSVRSRRRLVLPRHALGSTSPASLGIQRVCRILEKAWR